MFSFVAFEYFLKKKHVLKFEFLKWIHLKDNKIKLYFYLIKVLKWFGGEDLGAGPQSFRFKL